MGLVLRDTGSETTLIRTGFAAQLGVQGPKQNLTVDAVGGVTTTVKSQRVPLSFAPSVTQANVNAWTMKIIIITNSLHRRTYFLHGELAGSEATLCAFA